MTDAKLPADLFADLDRGSPIPLWFQMSSTAP